VETEAHSGTLLATNTSGLKVSDVAQGMRSPDRLVAMHFWNPAHLIPIVEICGQSTVTGEVERAVALARLTGKIPVVLKKEVLGFLGTRMQQAVVRGGDRPGGAGEVRRSLFRRRAPRDDRPGRARRDPPGPLLSAA
jgi:3-hydroxyacyl-CoA dehydrogenase